jgi:drug/metabolite transporter (DMT)-like permease
MVSATSYALTNIFSRVAVTTADPLVAPVFRVIPTLAISWGQVLGSRARRRPRPDVGRRVYLILFVGGTLTSAGTVGFFYALREGGVVLTAPVLATGILWGALIAAVFLREPLTARMMAGILVAAGGVGLLGYARAIDTGGAEVSLLAIPLALIPAVGWAAASTCTRYALVRGVDKYQTVAISQGWGLVALVLFLLMIGRQSLLVSVGWEGIWPLLLAGLLTAAAQITLAQALTLTTVASVHTINGANPVISAIMAWLLLAEVLTLLMVAGIAVTVVGVVYAQLSKVVRTEAQ